VKKDIFDRISEVFFKTVLVIFVLAIVAGVFGVCVSMYERHQETKFLRDEGCVFLETSGGGYRYQCHDWEHFSEVGPAMVDEEDRAK
jgi:hypothetical protein